MKPAAGPIAATTNLPSNPNTRTSAAVEVGGSNRPSPGSTASPPHPWMPPPAQSATNSAAMNPPTKPAEASASGGTSAPTNVSPTTNRWPPGMQVPASPASVNWPPGTVPANEQLRDTTNQNAPANYPAARHNESPSPRPTTLGASSAPSGGERPATEFVPSRPVMPAGSGAMPSVPTSSKSGPSPDDLLPPGATTGTTQAKGGGASSTVDAMLPPGASPANAPEEKEEESDSPFDNVQPVQKLAPGVVVLPTAQGGYVAVDESNKLVNYEGEAVAVRRLTPEEKARRRMIKNIFMGVFGVLMLTIVALVLILIQ